MSRNSARLAHQKSHCIVKSINGDVLDAARRRWASGVVEEGVNPTVVFHCKACNTLPIRFACRISRYLAGTFTKPLSNRLSLDFAPSREAHSGTFGNEQFSGSLADPASCASHDCHFIVEHPHLIPPVCALLAALATASRISPASF
jgi:hypothetical protein